MPWIVLEIIEFTALHRNNNAEIFEYEVELAKYNVEIDEHYVQKYKCL